MTLYLETAIRVGPFRFALNPSGGGITARHPRWLSRIRPRAFHIEIGNGRPRYRASETQISPPISLSVGSKPGSAESVHDDGVPMIEVSSSNVLTMRNEDFAAILNNLNAPKQTVLLAILFALAAALLASVALFFQNYTLFGSLTICVPLVWRVGKELDIARGTTVFAYEFAEASKQPFQQLTEAFDQMLSCAGIWHATAGGAVRDLTTWKQNAGASYLLDRADALLSYSLPFWVRSNVLPPALHIGERVIYFFPDTALVHDGLNFGAVAYEDLRIRWQDSDMVEQADVPADVQVVGFVWEHPNANGSPDKRFRSNRQFPVCRYEAVHFESLNGLNELVAFSRAGVGASFAAAVDSIASPNRGQIIRNFGSFAAGYLLPWQPPR